jgi:hypothetical protein
MNSSPIQMSNIRVRFYKDFESGYVPDGLREFVGQYSIFGAKHEICINAVNEDIVIGRLHEFILHQENLIAHVVVHSQKIKKKVFWLGDPEYFKEYKQEKQQQYLDRFDEKRAKLRKQVLYKPEYDTCEVDNTPLGY